MGGLKSGAGPGTGSVFIWASQAWLEGYEGVRFEALEGANARKTLLVVGIMTAHALGEGAGVGVSFCGHRGLAQVCCHLPQVPRGINCQKYSEVAPSRKQPGHHSKPISYQDAHLHAGWQATS